MFRDYFKFIIPVLILLGLLVIGTVGYMIIDSYSLMNAFYMTVITMGTVGYQEVEPLSDAGRIFTAFLIITSIGTFAYAVTRITKFVIDGELNEFFKKNKLNESINKLENHVIICGYGRNGRQAAHVLRKQNKRFVVIESNPAITSALNHKFSELIITGDATQDHILLEAGILKAKALITTLPEDSDNVFIVLSARNLNSKLTIISRASDDGSDAKLKIAGANNVIMPDKVGGAHMASLVMNPDVMEFLDHISAQSEGSITLEEISCEMVPDNLKVKSLHELSIRNVSGANIVGFKTVDGKYIINPSPDTNINQRSKLFVLGSPEQILKLKELLGGE